MQQQLPVRRRRRPLAIGARARSRAVVAVAVAALALPPMGGAGVAAPLMSPAGRTPARSEVAALLPQAREIADRYRSPWNAALALVALVGDSLPPGWGSCSDYAFALEQLGRAVSLDIRVVAGSANLLNDYDTHTTTEVWLAGQQRWVIVDPTFGGYFRLGPSGRLLGANDLRTIARRGRPHDVWWYGVGRSLGGRPEDYYIDPVELFRYVGVYAWLGDRLDLVTGTDAAVLSGNVADVERETPPSGLLSVTFAPQTPVLHDWTEPPYARGEAPAGYVGAIVATGVGAPPLVGGYLAAPLAGGRWLSPVFNGSADAVRAALPGATVYTVARFSSGPGAARRPESALPPL